LHTPLDVDAPNAGLGSQQVFHGFRCDIDAAVEVDELDETLAAGLEDKRGET
jgi:hypothetical protein